MKIFINRDDYGGIAIKTQMELIGYAKERSIEIVEDVESSDIVFSIGGDGTFLETAGIADGKPIVGINTGTLGYLTEINPENIPKALNDLVSGNYNIENRMMIEGEIIRKRVKKLRFHNL